MDISRGSKMPRLVMDCGPKCRSKQHGKQLASACSKGATRQLQLYLSKCHNCSSVSDTFGRNALHMAAAKGNWELAQWLIEDKKIDLTTKDLESGWTALHRALFYGQITTARLLLSCGATLNTRDKEGLAPLDLAMKDRLPHVEFVSTGLNEPYSWGDNSNFTLGHDTEHRKRQPEIIDFFRKENISIKQVAMSKYHTVFLSADGRVFTCGHGRGGRLGHGNEQTYLMPKQIESLNSQFCEQVSAARDHTLLLMENGSMYSCGLNESHQLGILPPQGNQLIPKMVNAKSLKGKDVKGIFAQRFHSVVHTDSAVFTFGLNAGQLGHLKVPGELLVTQPRMVSAFNHKDFAVKHVAASDAATIVASGRGDVYALHEYQCRKIASKWLDIEQIAVSGGHLDHSTDLETLREKGGYELVILLLNSAGKVYIWRGSEPNLKRCMWSVKRSLHVKQMSLSVQNFTFVTTEGEAFKATIPQKRQKSVTTPPGGQKEFNLASSPPVDTFTMTVTDLVEREEIEHIAVERLPLIHRAVNIVVDKKGNNFTALQAQPNANLTEIPTVEDSKMGADMAVLRDEANEFDVIHDVVLEVGIQRIPAHKYILACKSDHFRKLFTEQGVKPHDGEKLKVRVENVNDDIFLQMMKFIYTDTCDLLTIGAKFAATDRVDQSSTKMDVDIPEPTYSVHDGKKQSAFEVYGNKKKKKGTKEGKKGPAIPTDQPRTKNPVVLLQQTASRFGVKSLVKRLDAVKWVNGKVEGVHGKHLTPPHPRFERNKHLMLHDICIRGTDDVSVKCHKCVLVARLEYFRSMLASGWIETSASGELTLPIPGDILQVVINYLYTDDGGVVTSCEDVELLCNILVVADQLLINRLKHICEARIAHLLLLKNVCEVLEFASIYNANRLKRTCQQFVCLNLAALLETRSLDVLSAEVADELTTFYRNVVPGMDRRLITPYDEPPSTEELELLESEYEGFELSDMTEPDQHTKDEVTSGKKSAKKGKKSRAKTSSIGDESDSDDVRKRKSSERQISIGSDLDFPLELNFASGDHKHSSQDEPPRPDGLTIQISRPNLVPVWTAKRSSAEGHDRESGCPTQQTDLPDQKLEASSPPRSNMGQNLRDIMAEEMRAQSSQQQKTFWGVAPSTKPKLSNNEKRRLAKKQKLDLPIDRPEIKQHIDSPPVEGTKPKQAWTGWGSSGIGTVVSSFKDLMLDDEKSEVKLPPSAAQSSSPPTSGRGDYFSLSWGLSQPKAVPAQNSPPSAGLRTPTSPKENPWTKKTVESQAVKFSSIVEDEIQQRESLHKATNKPLSLIQIEEQAMQELRQQYEANLNVDEFITVHRVAATMASPTWQATSNRH